MSKTADIATMLLYKGTATIQVKANGSYAQETGYEDTCVCNIVSETGRQGQRMKMWL